MNQTYDWYAQLAKPSFAPPAWVFGPVWTVLYVIIAITFARIIYLAVKRQIPRMILVPIVINLISNFSYTYIQFGLKSNVLAAIDILIVFGSLVWVMASVRPFSAKLANWQIPYLAWVSFATVLQLTITWLNGGAR